MLKTIRLSKIPIAKRLKINNNKIININNSSSKLPYYSIYQDY